MSKPDEIRFDGVRMRYDSAKSYDELLAALLADIGEPVSLDDLVRTPGSWDSFQQQVEPLVGPSGFMLFNLIDHGAWITKAGIDRRLMRVILGKPADRHHDAASRRERRSVRPGRDAARRRGLGSQQLDLRQAVIADGRRAQPEIAQRR